MFSRYVIWSVIGVSVSVPLVQGINFPYENITLSDADVANNPSVAFGPLSSPSVCPTSIGCKVFPGDKQWPSDSQWAKFNSTLGGVLIKGVPPALVCYTGTYDATQCATVTAQYFNGTLIADNPVRVENEWLDGDSCPAQAYNNVLGGVNTTTPSCDVAAYPAYVVNVTTVKRKIHFFWSPYSIHRFLFSEVRWRRSLGY
jgi:hypothetical protein